MPGGGNLLFKTPNHGGVLIEFAFSIPVLIFLLFFVSDHYRFYELKNKIRASTYLAASMVQQIGNTRTDKQLTSGDFQRICLVSCFNFFHTNSVFFPWPFGFSVGIDLEYVKRLSSDNYQYQQSYSSCKKNGFIKYTGSLYTKTKAWVKDLNPNLVCNKDGDERLLITYYYRKQDNFDKSKLGLFLLEPQAVPTTHGSTIIQYEIPNLFIYRLVITPKPGLFPARND